MRLHNVATSINGFYFVLIDVGHHLEVGRVSRGLVTLHWTHTRAGRPRTCHVTLTSMGLGGQGWSAARCLASGQSRSSCQCEHTSSSRVKDV